MSDDTGTVVSPDDQAAATPPKKRKPKQDNATEVEDTEEISGRGTGLRR